MRTTHLLYRMQARVPSRSHSRLRVQRLTAMIAMFLVAVAMLVQAGSPAGAQDASPVDLAAGSDPILPLGDSIIVEDDTGGEAIMGKPAVAGDGSKFLVVWRAENQHIRGARVAHDGTLLDPGGIDILVSPETSGFPTVGFDGTNFVVFFSHVPAGQSTWELYAVRVAPDGTVLDPAGVRLTTGASLKEYRMLGVAFDGTNFLIPWRSSASDVYVARVSSTPANLDGPTGVLVSGNHASWYPAVAFDGTNFLVTWHDGRAAPYDVYGARVTTDGVVLDPGGFLIASGPGHLDHQGVAFDGTNYLVVWRDRRPNPLPDAAYVYGTRVTPAGAVLDDPPILVADDQWAGVVPIAAASDGDGFLVVWTTVTPSGGAADFRLADVFARRVSSGGEVLDAAAIPIGVAHWHQVQPTIGYDSGRFLVAWGQTGNEVAARLLARQAPPPPPTGSVGGPLDGGWVAETNPVPGGFYADVQAFDSEHAYAGGGVPWPVSTNHIVKRDASGWSVDYVPAYGTPYGMWAGGTDDVWTAGWCAAAFHFDGAAWSNPTGCFAFSAGQDRVGENIWGDGEGTVLSANTDGHILRIDPNERWQLDAQIVPNDLWDIWGSWRDDVWAVGADATVLHFDGLSWTKVDSIPSFQSINGISGSSSDSGLAVGDFGTILHWDGVAWSAQASGTLRHLFDVWVASPDETYAVGLGGTILHYTGGVWVTEDAGTTNALLGVSGVRDAASGVLAVWATGDGVLLRTEKPLAVDPVGAADRYVVDEDTVLSVGAGAGVLANDFDPEGDPLTAAMAEPPRLGTLDLRPNGSFVYIPDPDVDGIDAFWYDVTDGSGGIDTVRVVVEIVPAAEEPMHFFLPLVLQSH